MIIKSILLLSILLTNVALANKLMIGEFDQAKLGEILERLPDTVRHRIILKRFWFSRDYTIRSTFPKEPNAFSITCESEYFNGSPYPSTTTCDVTVDADHPRTIDDLYVLKIRLENSEEASSLYAAIPYGVSVKKFNSYGRDEIINPEGKPTMQFHYQFLCHQSDCTLNFSKKALMIETFTK